MALRIFLLLFCTFLLLGSREPPWADAHVVYDTTQSLLTRGTLHVDHLGGHSWFYAHRDGHKYGVFPLGNVLAMIPSYLSYRVLRTLFTGLPEGPLYAFASHLSPALLMALAAALLSGMCLRGGASRRMALLLSLCMGLSTICFIYARSPYAEALQTLALLFLVERTFALEERLARGGAALLGVAAGVLMNAKLVYVLIFPIIAGHLFYMHVVRRGRAQLLPLLGASLWAALAFLPFGAAALWHNHLKTGSVLDSGYRIPGGIFSGDLLPGLYGFIFSTGKSVFLYSPPLLMVPFALRRALGHNRPRAVLLLAVMAMVTMVNAKFRHWHADYCWGPRHLCPLTPLALLLLLPWLAEALDRGERRLRRSLLGAVLAAGLLVQLLGAAFYWDFYIRILIDVKDQTGAAGWFKEQLGHGHYIPQFSPLRGHIWMLSHHLRRDPDMDRDAPWKLIVPQPARLRHHYEALRIDWWALDWLAGPERAPMSGSLLLGLLSGVALLSGLALRRRLRAAGAA